MMQSGAWYKTLWEEDYRYGMMAGWFPDVEYCMEDQRYPNGQGVHVLGRVGA